MHVVWFKRDLRAANQRPLLEASRRGPMLADPSLRAAYLGVGEG